jgi:desampylase
MMRNSVTVPPRILAGLRRHAAAAAPAECCGALIGVAHGTSVQIRCQIPVENGSAAPDEYHIGAETVLRLERQAECAGVQVVGFYHSHPAAGAVPSAMDLDLACPGYIHLIVDASTGAIRAWRLRTDRSGFDELPLAAPLQGAA